VAARPYPLAAEFAGASDAAAVADIEWLKAVLGEIRRIRSEMNIAPGKQIPLLFAKGAAADRTRVERFAEQIAFLARTESQAWLDAGQQEPASASAIVGELRVLIPLAGLIDIEAEKARLNREIKRIEGEIANCLPSSLQASASKLGMSRMRQPMRWRNLAICGSQTALHFGFLPAQVRKSFRNSGMTSRTRVSSRCAMGT
jgi:valyl-tRNA synthetase